MRTAVMLHLKLLILAIIFKNKLHTAAVYLLQTSKGIKISTNLG